MLTDDQFGHEKLQYNINREELKYQPYRRVKLINMNILLVKKYYHSISNK